MLDGFLNGIKWNDSARKFEILKLGSPEEGAIIVGLNVAGKDKDGNKVYGQPLKVKINIKSASEGKRVLGLIEDGKLCQFDGFLVPDNYTNKDGKEIKGHMYLVYKSETLTEKQTNSGGGQSAPAKQEAPADDNPWA